MEHNNRLYLTSMEEVLLDANYRYIIGPLQITHGNKKGKPVSILTNIDSFTRELQFNKQHFIELMKKILSKKMSCRCTFEESTGFLWLSGHYLADEIKQTVYTFIQHYLLCNTCDKPEINMKYKKDRLKQTCRACGAKMYISSTTDHYDIILHVMKKCNE